MPGYAWYEKGVLIESGIIEVDYRLNKSLRLYEIARTIREEFPVPDILVVEYIPPVSYRGGMNNVAIMALQKSIGAIVGAHPFKNLLEIPASAWKAYKTEDYVKSDQDDAVMLGRCAIMASLEIRAEDDIVIKKVNKRKKKTPKKKVKTRCQKKKGRRIIS